jgi:DNA-binding MarR family transcriptional regulator
MDQFSLILSLENVAKYFERIKSSKIAEFGIRIAHFNCLIHIDLSADGLTPTELSKNCGVDKAFISRTTSDLVKGGFIETNQKYEDGRKYRLKYILTEKGKFVLHETKKTVEHYFSELGNKIGEYEMNSFMRVMGMIDELAHKDQAEA